MIIKDREPKIFDEEPSKLTLEQAKNFYDVPIYEKEPYDRGASKVLEAGAESFITSIKKTPSQLQMATGQLQYSQGEKIKSDVEFLNKVLPEGGRIYNGNKTVDFGDKLMETGKLNIQTANRNLETLNRELEQSMPNLSPEDREGLLLASVPALGDFGVMLALSYVHPSIGLGYMALRTFGAETEEGAEVYKAKQFEKSIKENQELLKNMTPEERKKALEEMMSKSIEGFEGKSVEEIRLNLANTAVQTILEKAFGVPPNLKRLTKHKELLKKLFLGGVEEVVTENAQNITDAIFAQIGDRLAEDETIFSRFMDDLKYTVIAFGMGGTAGVAFGLGSRARGIEQIENLLVGTNVDQSKINQYATVLYDSAVDNLQGIVSKELELDSSLKAKHGEVYNNLVKQMKLQIEATGALEGKSELQKAQYISQTAKEQADLLLGESFKRNTTIDNVWKATEAVFRDGRLYLQGKTEKPKATRKPRQYNPERMELLTYLKYTGGIKDVGGDLKAMDAGKLKIGLINNKSGRSLDDAMFDAWESGYFPEFVERPTVNDLLEAVRAGLSGKKRYRESFRPVVEAREAEAKGLLAEAQNEQLFDSLLSARFTDDELKDMPLDAKEKLYTEMVEQINAVSEDDYIQQEIDSLTDDEAERYAIMTENGATHDEAMQEIKSNRTPDEDIPLFFQESFDIAEENARLDEIHPEYKGETININGVEKTVYNSNGDRIAMSEPALRNFYKWFGDSKVVDEQGRPLVVYHGSDAEFDTFDIRRIGKFGEAIGHGFYFAGKNIAEKYDNGYIYPVYLKLENPVDYLDSNKIKKSQIEDIADWFNDNYIESEDGHRLFVDNLKYTLKGRKIDSYWISDILDFAEFSEKDVGKAELYQDIYKKLKEVTGVDGFYQTTDIGTTWVAFNPNQIKSTSNRGTYSESDNIYYQTEEFVVENKTNRNNPTRIKQRAIEDFLPEEKEAFDRFLSNRADGERILNNLKINKYDHKGRITGYYKTVIEDIFIQQAILDYIDGKEINYESAIDVKTRAENGSISTIKSLLQSREFKSKNSLEDKLEFLADRYLDGSVLAHPAKVVNAVNSSLLNCNPSRDCAIFCYATHGNYARGSYSMPKSEVIDLVARYHPKKLAKMIASEYKLTTEYNMGKALRLFDKGDGNDHWVDVARELNNQGIRVAIFTKRPDFMRKVNELKTNDGKEINLTMLSIDSSNQHLAEENKDLKVAYVYQGEQNLDFVKNLQDENRLSVVLPVKLDGKTMSNEEVRKLNEKGIQTKKICPIDAGRLKVPSGQKTPSNIVDNGQLKPAKVGTWNCALCDRMGGVGCYFGRTTEQIISYLKSTDKKDLNLPEKDVKSIINGFEEILKRQTITEGLTNEQLKQFGITEQDIEKRVRLLSPTMGEANARNFAGYSLLLNWFGQRHANVQQSVQDKATETGLLQRKDRPVKQDNEPTQGLYGERESSARKQSYTSGVPADISEDSGTNVRLDEEYYQKSKKQNKIKGAFDKLTKSIKITSEADYSTYKHEFAHFWLDNIWNYANSGQASENYLKQFNELKKWLGTKGNYPTRNQHEKFARAYEKYIYNGTYAKSPIGDVFGEYENFIREVYSDISEIDTRAGVEYKPIPRVVYNFFDSMVSGKLPGVIIDDEPKKEVEKDEKEVREFIKEENKILEENRANYTLKPVQTDTKTGYLTAYGKMTGEQVEAGSMELKDQMEKAENFVANNLEQAERIVNGLEQAPDGIVKNAVYVAYNNLQKKLGNTDKRANSMLNQALELRRMGQEIASQRLAYADVEGEASATFWIKEVIKNKAEALADANSLTVTELSDKIDNAISDGIANNKKPEDIVKQLGEELGVTEFYQTEVLSGFGDVDTYAHSYIKRYVNERLGLGMSKTEAETIIRKADDMLASLQNSRSETTGNPSVDYFVKLKDMENYANSLAPSSEMRVAMSVIGRGNLLASIKSPVTNIVSNGFVGAFRGVVRRINLGVRNSIVSPELIKQNKAYSWEIFKKTGYNVNNITKDKPRNLILGEKLTHSEGKGFIRGLGRLYEKTVYKWGLGAGDVVFKDYAFADYVALKATKLANGDVAKANEIFKDACLIEPKTKDGAEIRKEAIQESLISTYQNDGLISDKALKVRKTMDFGVGFGEFIAPFVKTPANVVSMGLKSGFGSVKALVSEIKKYLKTISRLQKENPNKSIKEIMEMKEFKDAVKLTQENIDLFIQNGLGVLLAFALMSAIDDDDYMPPYALASSKDKQLAKELNIPYNAIRIGNTWVSLDYLGVLASPLVGLLQARREDGVINSIFGYAKSGGIQALSIPAFGNVADLFENIKNTVRKDGVDALADAGGELLEQAYARAVPSIISDVAKALDPYDRETKGNEIITKIPFARETSDKRVSATTGRAEKLGNPVYDILFGARVKEQVSNSVADELLRLNNVGYGVSLTTVTRSGLLSELDEETKQKVREDFATDYSKELARLIRSPRYSKSDDEEKQEMINKIRRDIINKLKRRYLKNRK